MSPRPRALSVSIASIVGLVVALAGCAPGPTPSGTPTASPTASPGSSPGSSGSTGAISHPTGPADLILRVSVGGGFVAPGYLATEAPAFSLYGDGTLIFRDPGSPTPSPIGVVTPLTPFLTAKLTEDQVQALLADALDEGGLRTALAQYTLPVADAPTTTFTVAADAVERQVSVNGLGIVAPVGADGPILARLAALRERLLRYGSTLSGTEVWAPGRYRGILMEATILGAGTPWPWPSFSPNEFVQSSDLGTPPFPIRTLTPTDVAALGFGALPGGAQGITLISPLPAGTIYSFSLRPLLPDEAS